MMNKTKSLIIALAILLMGVMVQSCGTMTSTAVAAAMAEQLNKDCPSDAGSGFKMESATSEGNNVIVTVSFDIDEMLSALAQQFGMPAEMITDSLKQSVQDSFEEGFDKVTSEMKPAMVQGMQLAAEKDADMKKCLELVKTTNVNIVYRFKTPSGKTSDIVIESKDWK